MQKRERIVAFIVLLSVVSIIILLAPKISSLIQKSNYAELTIPRGGFRERVAEAYTAYSDHQGARVCYLQYAFSYCGVFGDRPRLLQVWESGSASPKDLFIREGATYTVFAIEIKISQIHSDYIVILVKPLS